MSDLDNIVQVTINRETQAVSVASFGTLGIISEFATSRTTPAFERFREYGSLAEMTDEGFLTTDKEYLAASIALSQNPKVSKFMIGRLDAADTDIAAGLNAIQAASQDWYGWLLIATAAGSIVFDADLIADNQVDIVINGETVDPVTFITDHDTTMDAIITQIETDVTGATASLDPEDLDNRTILVDIDDGSASGITAVVTLGVSQAGATISYILDDDYKAAAAWNETQKKILFIASSEADILNAGSTTDLAYFLNNLAYDRSVCIYHTAAQENATPSWIESGWPGECLPFDPGSQTWAYKTIAGVATYALTTGEKNALFAKKANSYTTIGGVNVTEQGTVASGEYIDIIRGIDWIEARLQEAIYGELVNKRKIPYTDEGIALIENAISAVLKEAARQGILILDSIVINVPLLSDIPTADKLARNLPDITFTADLQGAIHKVQIVGTVTV